ncbi:protein TonB [Agaricicola taiwanensis]|uniref:Protein TonB n=1 Tax=Agaricicola taiwanensis TaxID=591372 RepID=A0A8J2VQD5_9RHOB|nr:energy transducer TonB [Agaricicola taiwanensis]GGE37865.1 protein TonB [Agaricicola taiwanensis]
MSLVIPYRHENGLTRDLGLWGGAAAVVVAAHLGIAAAVMAFRDEPEAGGAPETAIMIELAPLTTSIDAPELAEPADIAAEQQLEEPTPDAEPEPEVLEPLEPPPLQPLPEPIIEMPEPEVVPVKPEAVLPVARPKQPDAKPEEKTKPEELKKERPKRKKVVTKPKSEVSSQRSATNAPRAERSAAAEASTSASNANALAAWQNRVSAKIRRFRRAGTGVGTVRVQLVIDANGNIRSSQAASGNPILDRAALDMVRRANPLPAPPPESGMANKPFIVPILFTR